MKPKILVTRKIADSAEQQLSKNFDATLNLEDKPYTYDELITLCNQYDGIIVTSWNKFDKKFFDKIKDKLQIISTVAVGYDNIDINAAKEKKIVVTNSPKVLNNAVAETTLLLMLGAARRAYDGLTLVKSNKWKDAKVDFTNFMVGQPLTEKTLGIIGMGRIGQIVAERARGFGMKIIYYNRKKLSSDLEKNAKYFENVNSMMSHCDFISVHCPATPETKNILNAEAIKLLPKHAIVINTSRGITVDDDALIDALQNKKIYAAGLDVFNNEPKLDERYLKLDNCFTLPHIGSANHETRAAMSMLAVKNIEAHFLKKNYPSRVV
jgi:glyoxylate reductase